MEINIDYISEQTWPAIQAFFATFFIIYLIVILVYSVLWNHEVQALKWFVEEEELLQRRIRRAMRALSRNNSQTGHTETTNEREASLALQLQNRKGMISYFHSLVFPNIRIPKSIFKHFTIDQVNRTLQVTNDISPLQSDVYLNWCEFKKPIDFDSVSKIDLENSKHENNQKEIGKKFKLEVYQTDIILDMDIIDTDQLAGKPNFEMTIYSGVIMTDAILKRCGILPSAKFKRQKSFGARYSVSKERVRRQSVSNSHRSAEKKDEHFVESIAMEPSPRNVSYDQKFNSGLLPHEYFSKTVIQKFDDIATVSASRIKQSDKPLSRSRWKIIAKEIPILLINNTNDKNIEEIPSIVVNDEEKAKSLGNISAKLSNVNRLDPPELLPLVIVLRPRNDDEALKINLSVRGTEFPVEFHDSEVWLLVEGSTIDQTLVKKSSQNSTERMVSFSPQNVSQIARMPRIASKYTSSKAKENLNSKDSKKWFAIEEMYGSNAVSKSSVNVNSDPASPMTPMTPVNISSQEDETSNLCVVCLTDPSQVVILPCRHKCMCLDCFKSGPNGESYQQPNIAREQAEGNDQNQAGAQNIESDGTDEILSDRNRTVRWTTCPVCRTPLRAWIEQRAAQGTLNQGEIIKTNLLLSPN